MIARLPMLQVKSRFVGSRAFFFGPALAFILFLVSAPALAGLSISPNTQEVAMAPGGETTGCWRIRNDANQPVRVRLTALAYRDYLTGHRDAPPPAWLALPVDSFELAAHEDTIIWYRVQLPDTATGEQMAMVFAGEQPLSGAPTVQGRIGMAFYVMAAGTLHPRLTLNGCQSIREASGRYRFMLQIGNPGDVHLRPRGELEIVDSGGRVVDRSSFDMGMPVQVGGQERFFTRPTAKALAPGEYTVRLRVNTGEIDGVAGPVLGDTLPLVVQP